MHLQKFTGNVIARAFFIILATSCGIYAAGVMRDISSMNLVKDMKVGWNLGNTFDAPNETAWNKTKPTQGLIDAVYKMGFKTMRLPVTWDTHIGSSPNYTIDKAWLDRVEEVANYALKDSMYVILNTHHDNWVTLTTSSQTQITDKITKVWTQIANRFKDYSDYLVFETLNEPRLIGDASEWNGGTTTSRTVLNAYNAAIVSAIRATGGNNALRHIMIPTTAATPMAVAQDALAIPAGDSRIIVSQHTYWPYNFTMNTGSGMTTTWGTAKDKSDCDAELDRIATKFVKKGIPVIIGEWGSIYRNNNSDRAVHAEYYANAVRKRGMLPVWWDNGPNSTGNFGLIDRSSLSWFFPEIAQGLIRGANAVAIQSSQPLGKQPSPSSLSQSLGLVKYTVSKMSSVSLRVYSAQGKKILDLVNNNQPAGNYEVKLPKNSIALGHYILELRAGNQRITQNLSIIE